MTITRIVDKADLLRQNSIPIEVKEKWVKDLDGQFAEMFGIDPTDIDYEQDDLLVQFPYEEVYVLHLCAQIDLAQGETDLYQDDMMQANQLISEARAWYRRNHCPEKGLYRKKGVYH